MALNHSGGRALPVASVVIPAKAGITPTGMQVIEPCLEQVAREGVVGAVKALELLSISLSRL